MQNILGIDLDVEEDSIIEICGDLHVKSPLALETLLAALRTTGYSIKNLREDTSRKVSVEVMEKNGWSLWFASLDVTRGKCRSCSSIISVSGIRSHGHTCEKCGAVTYYDIIDGSIIRFSFIQRDDKAGFMADITMKAKRWDTETGQLYLYPEVMDGLWRSGDSARAYLEENRDKWSEVEEDGQKLVCVKYPLPWDYESSAINPSDISGHYHNHSIVKVWQEKEYAEFAFFDKKNAMPVREMISIFETWHHPRLPRSPTLHTKILSAARQTSDKGWHYQDGRPWFQPANWKNMSKFVRHFTELDADEFDREWPHFRSDGPGGIEDLARFCHENPEVENRPNIGNLLVGISKISSGKQLTDGEARAANLAAADPETMGSFADVMTGKRRR
jgi:hypothetical protein